MLIEPGQNTYIMILYLNGDSHGAGAEAVNTFCFAEDDGKYLSLGRQPHPDNLAVSYGKVLANQLGAILQCDAESASSNDRVIRTTKEYLTKHTPDLIVIGWSSWEREEWLYEGKYWQVNAGGAGQDWPKAVQEQHRNWVLTVDYNEKIKQAHNAIWEFHKELANIPHLFFNCFSAYKWVNRFDWGDNYVGPYDNHLSYREWLLANGFKTVNPNSYHFGSDAHNAWADFLYQNYIQNRLTKNT